jgi:hypothetical protein
MPLGLSKMRGNLMIVFSEMKFIGDLDNSNFNSLMGRKPDWRGWKSGDRK